MKKLILASVVASVCLQSCSVIPTNITERNKQIVIANDAELLKKLSYLGPDPVLALPDIVARAVLFNKDREIASLELKLAGMDSSQSYLNQLPTLVQRLNYDKRNELAGSNSATFADGELREPTSESYLVSSKPETFRSDLTLTMNLLDYGVAYGRAEILANEVLIAREKERQAIQNVVQKAENMYWRVVAAEKLEQELSFLLAEVLEAIELNDLILSRNLQDPLQNYTFQRELLDVERTLKDLRRDLSTAKTQLDELIGVKPNTEYRLLDVEDELEYMPKALPDDVTLETIALLNRSDLTENLVQNRILKTEKENAVMKLMPQVKVNAGYYRDNSPYNLNEDWVTINPEVSWDLMHFLRFDATTDKLNLRRKLLDEQRLQITIGILAIVDSSKTLLAHNIDRYELAKRYTSVSANILEQLNNTVSASRGGELAVIKEKLNLLLAKHRSDLTYSEIRATVGQTIQALGLDLVPEDYNTLSVNQLARVVDNRLSVWYELNDEDDNAVMVATQTDTRERREEVKVSSPVVTAMPENTLPAISWSVQLYSAKGERHCKKFLDKHKPKITEEVFIINQHGFCKVRLGPYDKFMHADKHIAGAQLIAKDSIVVKTYP